MGGLNLYAFLANNSINDTDDLGQWNSKVHYGMTITWSAAAGFGPSHTAMIAEADDGVDHNLSTSPFPWGKMERHLNQPSRTGGKDSRDYWYDKEYANAVKELDASDKDQVFTHCSEAAHAFGRALHSRQDRSAHRVWPDGGDWSPGIAHPACREGQPADGRNHVGTEGGRSEGKNQWEKHGNTNAVLHLPVPGVPPRSNCRRFIHKPVLHPDLSRFRSVLSQRELFRSHF